MSKTLFYLILVVFAATSIVLVAVRPDWVSDQNTFLRDFVNHEFLNLLGVILAITLASVANMHLEFNKIEERFQRAGLSKSRQNIKKAAYWLIGLFVAGVTVVTLKPLFGQGAVGEGVANMAALLIVLWHVLILIILTQLVFAIPPHIKKTEDQTPSSPQDTGGENRR